ncbi:polymorphic toxin-type HINT domain-containing protein [Streptacidiphilus albus]|uniref:polymorphic toxin-type HINT domain-containing protein n=1 Tax=Streptacidiphilus albus TaxID=105425 RepID=UPI000A6E20AF|nr:polymorphic toxin-type HINT domain-containing protein [Streptacidiphilus albus]
MQSGTPSDAATNSAWGVPVLDPISGDPCYTSAKGTASQCAANEGWRWNLDFVVSPTGFVQRYDYSTETNYYDLGGGQVAASNGSGTLTPYIRGGALTQISYGYQLDDELAGHTPAAQVVFSSQQRCQVSSGFNCTQPISLSNASNWPDVPYDLDCPSNDSTTIPPGTTSIPAGVCVQYSPSFWSTTRLDSITTKVNVAAGNVGLTPVDTYQLGQTYSDAGGSVDPVTGADGVDAKDEGSLQAVMWLASIQHTGDADTYDGGGTPITLGQATFAGVEIDNRVNDNDPSAPALYRPRIADIYTETGEAIAVNYNQTPCLGLTLSIANADTNTNSCYPVYWTPTGEVKPIADWFNKITVKSVVNSDQTGASKDQSGSTVYSGSEAQESDYSYSGAAWHRDDSAQTDDQYRTWDQFRGFRTVTVTTGTAPEPVTQTVTTYLQGMDGDYLANGTQRSVSVNAVYGGTTTEGNASASPAVYGSPTQTGGTVAETVKDSDWLAGTPLETDTYTKASGIINPAVTGGTIDAETVNGPFTYTKTVDAPQTPWTDWNATDDPPPAVQPTLSTLPDLDAYRPASTTSSSFTLVKNGTAWRENKSVTDYDAQGRLSTVDSTADVTGVSAPAQETCTATTYAAPSGLNPMMLSYPDRTTEVSGGCAAPTSSTLRSDREVYYDGDGTLTNLGTFGQLDQSANPEPAAGEVTATSMVTSISPSNVETWQTTAAMTYDGAGRIVQTLDANKKPTTTMYSPAWNAAGGNTNPVTEQSTNSQGWTTKSKMEPLRGLDIEDQDTNGRITDTTYDALGRRTAVWLPGQSQATQSASETFSYLISSTAPSAVMTNTLRTDGSYATSVTLYDGMLQPRQTQTDTADNSAGRLISDTFYDSHGWPVRSYAPYTDTTTYPSSTLAVPDAESQIPSETVTDYDGQGRPLDQQLYTMGAYQWQSTSSYPGADETDSTGPAGSATTVAVTNALGQTTSSTVKDTDGPVKLTPGQVIPSGTSLNSGSVQLTMQAGGNLVLTSLASGATLWSSGTSSLGAWATFQTGGNFVVYSSTGTALWSSGTSTTGKTMQIQNDGNVVVYNAAGTALWSTGTSGKASEADATTSYTYTPAGQVHTVSDAAGNTWSYTYNLLGQKLTATDPNMGTTTYGPYDDMGNLEQTTDPRGQTLSYQYDWDNRVTGEYSGPFTATPDPTKQLSGYVYDTLENGYPTSATEYVSSTANNVTTVSAYTQAVTGYNTDYQPTGTSTTIPSADGFTAPAGTSQPTAGAVTFADSATYTPITGELASTTYGHDGGLPAETVNNGYDLQGLQNSSGSTLTSSTGATSSAYYLDNAIYTPMGQQLSSTYGVYGTQLVTTDAYDPATGRLTYSTTNTQTSKNNAIDNIAYRYNQAGEITAVSDLQSNGTSTTGTDTQCFTYNSLQRLTQAWTDTAGINTGTTLSPPITDDPTVGDVGGCNTATPQTTATAPITTTTVGDTAGDAYWQTYSYDLLGDRTGEVNHDTTGNFANNTTQTIAYNGANGTAPATDPNQATAVTTTDPILGSTTTVTPGYTDSNSADDGNTTSRTATSAGFLLSGVRTTAGGSLCLADPGASTTSGTAVVLEGCGSSGESVSIGSDGTVRVQGLCLDTSGGAVANGTTVVLDTCSGAASQQWKATATSLVNAHSGFCLADPSANQTPGAAKQLVWTCGGSGQTYTTPTDNTAVPAGQKQTITYNADGRTSSVTTPSGTGSQTSSYIYDASGNLLEQANTFDNTKILYLFGGAEQITLNVPNNSSTALRNYSGPDGTTITRSSAGTLSYQVANQQGTATTTINAATLAVTRRAYDPYGNPRGTTPATWVDPSENHGFLGQPTDASTGLDLLGARNYDPIQGRFTSPDPVFEAGDPNQMGGYTYAGDNPSSGSDPSGLMLNPATTTAGGGCAGDSCDISTPSSSSTDTSSGGSGSATSGCEGGGKFRCDDYNANHDPTPACGLMACIGALVTSSIATAAIAGVAACIVESWGAAAYVCANTAGTSVIAVCDLFSDCGPADGGGHSTDGSDGHDHSGDNGNSDDGHGGHDGTGAGSTGAITVAVDPPGSDTGDLAVVKRLDAQAQAQKNDALNAAPAKPSTGTSSTDGSGSGDGASGAACSFAPTTPVLLASGKTEPIGSLKVGDKVESADPNTGKEEGGRTVQHVWINHDTDLLDVTVSIGHGHTAVIHTTANHPFWDDTTHTWVRADHLKPGHKLASTDGQHPTVANIKITPGAADRWNLTVQQLHTYYVVAGGVPILVHNSSTCNVGLGYQKANVAKWANDMKFKHFTSAEYIDSWNYHVSKAIDDPATTIHVYMVGFDGDFEDMATRGLAGGDGVHATQQEMGWLARAVIGGRRSWGTINFYDEDGQIPEYPEPKWQEGKWSSAWALEWAY